MPFDSSFLSALTSFSMIDILRHHPAATETSPGFKTGPPATLNSLQRLSMHKVPNVIPMVCALADCIKNDPEAITKQQHAQRIAKL